MSLTNAAKLADDATAGGFQSRALAALVNEAQQVLADPATRSAVELAFARQVSRNPVTFKVLATWAVAGDPDVHATLTPSDSVLVAAAHTRWASMVRVGS